MSVLDRPKSNHRGGTATEAQKVLLACGVVYGLVYLVTNDVVAAMVYQGYSRMDQAISELSATSAPTRAFLVVMLPVGTALLVAFGIGVWITANGNRALRVTGGLLIQQGLDSIQKMIQTIQTLAEGSLIQPKRNTGRAPADTPSGWEHRYGECPCKDQGPKDGLRIFAFQ